MQFGRFRACSCASDVGKRKWLFEEYVCNGHIIGPFTVVVHEPKCFGMKGGNRAKVWLMKLKRSPLGRFEYNDYVHPDALPRGEVELTQSELRILEDAMAKKDWGLVRQLIDERLLVVARRNILSHFPKTKEAA